MTEHMTEPATPTTTPTTPTTPTVVVEKTKRIILRAKLGDPCYEVDTYVDLRHGTVGLAIVTRKIVGMVKLLDGPHVLLDGETAPRKLSDIDLTREKALSRFLKRLDDLTKPDGPDGVGWPFDKITLEDGRISRDRRNGTDSGSPEPPAGTVPA